MKRHTAQSLPFAEIYGWNTEREDEMTSMFSKDLFTTGSNNIFVFGSNFAGRHGRGAAKFAKEYCGAIYGQGFGLMGNSFAIPTKDEHIRTLPLHIIHDHVAQFTHFAEQNPQYTFYITPVGTGLAGYQDVQIAPMFGEVPTNCILPDRWKINEHQKTNILTSES